MFRSTPRRAAALLSTAVLLALVPAACGQEPDVVAGPSADATAPEDTAADSTIDPLATTSVVTTVASTTTAPPTTVVPTTVIPTTVTPTTVIPTTVTPPAPAEWTVGEFPPTVYPPCCASNWFGDPSPAPPADPTAPLADGIYHLTVAAPWDATRPDEITIEVRPFVWCGDLPEGSCEFYESFGPNELGVGDAVLWSTTLTLDDTIRVGVVGWENGGPVSQYGNGTDFVALASAFDAALTTVVAPRLAAGEASFDIIPQLSAAPEGGFGPIGGPYEDPYEIVFDAGSGPALLLQTVSSWDSMGGDGPEQPIPVYQELNATVLEMRGGAPTLYFYAGYYS